MSDAGLDRKTLVLTDGKINLRPYCDNDIESSYQAIRESLAELAPWLPFAYPNYSRKETRDWIKNRPKDWKKGIGYEFAILDAGDNSTMLGGCGLNGVSKLDHRANLGYWVRTGRMGQGIAPAATRLLARWGFETLKLTRIEVIVATGNQRSLRAAEKSGARREGVLRNRVYVRDKLYDAVMFSFIPGEV
jgi:ribosomal-protein-serine acetyltransferase